MRITLHRHIPEDAELRQRWNTLALQTESPQIFYSFDWALAMQEAYVRSLKPLCLIAREDNSDEIVGIASLASDESGKVVSFLAGNTADYCDFLSRPSRRAAFLNALFEEIKQLQPEQLVLANLPADSQTGAEVENAARAHGFYCFARPAYTCAQVSLGTGEPREKLKSAITRKKMFQRKWRTLEQKGTVGILHLRSWNAIAPALKGYADSHAAHFAETGRVSSLASPERLSFIENVAKRFSDARFVTMSVLTINDQPIAWNYGFQFEGSWFWYQPTFDSRWREYSPGYCLLARIIIDACDMQEIRVVDLGLGDEGYKDRFTNSSRETLHVTLSTSWKRHAREAARYRTASILKKAPAFDRMLRSALRR